MYIFKTVDALQQHLRYEKKQGHRVGFVPTMGALHKGHLTLISTALEDCDRVVCSIFVNPTQFDDQSDLDHYPRPIERDIAQLEAVGCAVLFLPTADEVYPSSWETPDIDLQGLDQSMEGAIRPGHFAGVVQVVHRLLHIVAPDALYMGQKDYQQLAIVQHLLRQTDSSVTLVRVPIVREPDGLAMSSRNVRLSEEGRARAPLIAQMLRAARDQAQHAPLQDVNAAALAFLNEHGLEADYFTIVNGDTLVPIQSFDEAPIATACTVVRIDGVRLLDNIILRER